jgi:hypothetical protein
MPAPFTPAQPVDSAVASALGLDPLRVETQDRQPVLGEVAKPLAPSTLPHSSTAPYGECSSTYSTLPTVPGSTSPRAGIRLP